MEDKRPESVPFIVHEGDMARLERSNRRLFIALVTALVVLVTQEIISEIRP